MWGLCLGWFVIQRSEGSPEIVYNYEKYTFRSSDILYNSRKAHALVYIPIIEGNKEVLGILFCNEGGRPVHCTHDADQYILS